MSSALSKTSYPSRHFNHDLTVVWQNAHLGPETYSAQTGSDLYPPREVTLQAAIRGSLPEIVGAGFTGRKSNTLFDLPISHLCFNQ